MMSLHLQSAVLVGSARLAGHTRIVAPSRLVLAPVCKVVHPRGSKSKAKGKRTGNKNVKKTANTHGGFGMTVVERPDDAPAYNDLCFPQLPEDLAYEDQAEYFLFVRKTKAEGAPGRWYPMGDITVDAADSNGVEAAVKERRVLLREYSEMKHLGMKILKQGEALEYGVRVQRGPVLVEDDEDLAAIKTLNVNGKIKYTVPAKLQLLSELVWNMGNKKEQMESDYVTSVKKKMMEEESGKLGIRGWTGVRNEPTNKAAPAQAAEEAKEPPAKKEPELEPELKLKPAMVPPPTTSEPEPEPVREPEPKKDDGPEVQKDGSVLFKF